jgi:hypothetical protein
MLDGPMPKLLTPGGVLHISSDSLEPLIVMGTVEPELVNVAEPFLTMQLMGSGGGVPGQVPVAVSVAVVPLGVVVNIMLPCTVVVASAQASSNVLGDRIRGTRREIDCIDG